MRKILISLAVMLFVGLIISSVYAKAGDMFSTGQHEEFRIDSNGDILVTGNGKTQIIEWTLIPAASTTTFTGLLGLTISTVTLVSGGTTFVEGTTGTGTAGRSNQFTQITFPRNITCSIAFLWGGSTTTVTGTLTVTGVDSCNEPATETIPISTGTKAAPGIGNVAWARVDTFALSNMVISGASGGDGVNFGTVSTCTINIGTGQKIGLCDDVRSSSDVYKFTIDHVDYKTTFSTGVNTTYDTLDMGIRTALAPNAARIYRIWLKAAKWFLE